jgi:hypothetical protein
VEQYERIMGVGAEATAIASRASMGLERGVMGTHTAKEAAALSND